MEVVSEVCVRSEALGGRGPMSSSSDEEEESASLFWCWGGPLDGGLLGGCEGRSSRGAGGAVGPAMRRRLVDSSGERGDEGLGA